jgi:hypothetical protein
VKNKQEKTRGAKRRFLGSLAIGAAVAAALVAFEDKYRRAALAASAAKPLPDGGHQSVTAILTDGGIGTALIVAVIVFAVGTVLAHRKSRAGSFGREWQDDRRSRAGVWR